MTKNALVSSNQKNSRVIDLSLIDSRETNANEMDPVRFKLLVNAIKKVGFLQPVLVRPKGDRFEVIDGHHRMAGAKELGMTLIPCIVEDMSDEQARALALGMNQLRGDLSLGKATAEMQILKEAGWTLDELTLTGFSERELADLLRTYDATPEGLLNTPDEAPIDTPSEVKPFMLEIQFKTKADMAKVKRFFRKAGSGDLTAGVLAVVGAD